MKCPECGLVNESHVYDTRSKGKTIERKRQCDSCNFKFKTYEVTEDQYETSRNCKKYIPWSEGERVTLVTLYDRGTKKEMIGALLGRSRQSVSRELDKLTASGDYFSILATTKESSSCS
ncbi:hypothetical protein ABEW81_11075 [Priestia megaterium]